MEYYFDNSAEIIACVNICPNSQKQCLAVIIILVTYV